MSLIGSNILVGASGNQGGYQINRSVRLRASASAYFNRTFSTPTDNKKWTYSTWFKRGQLTYGSSGASGTLLFAPSSANTFAGIYFTPTDIINWYDANGGATVYLLQTTQVFRDPSAWYHLVCTYDSAQATAANRQKMYVNGVQITAFGTASYVAQNTNGRFNSAVQHDLGRIATIPLYFDGEITEENFVDGQALTPTSFGEFNAITGVWQPKKYAGTYGTNGFYLNFSDNSAATAAAIGKDFSGNGNNWTPNNISVTAGATYDSMIDTPTPYADGNSGRGNYAVLNPLDKTAATTAADGNLNLTLAANVAGGCGSTIAVSSGKWYAEITPTSGAAVLLGIVLDNLSQNGANQLFSTGYGYYQNGGNKYVNGVSSAYGAGYAANDVIGIAIDFTVPSITFYKNNVSQGAITIAAGSYKFTASNGSSVAAQISNWNFGQRPFTYTPPFGFKALNTQNLPASTIENGANYMAATLYTGTGAARSVTNTVNGVSFQPDFVWGKMRNAAASHNLFDSVRGNTKYLLSDSTSAELTASDKLTSFNSNGFSLGADSTGSGQINTNGNSFVGWQWKAGGTAVTNTAGILTSQVSANTSAGFSACTYTAPASSQTNSFGHGLGIAPSMVIAKNRSSGTGGLGWAVYHISLGSGKYLTLNSTAAATTSAGYWGSGMTSTVVGLPTAASSTGFDNCTGNMVAYCFAEVAGYSKFGSYVGNGSTDGTFVYLGFRPRFVMIKRTDSTGEWAMFDSSRDTENVVDQYLAANSSAAEAVYPNDKIDFLSNGFKIRGAPGVINTNAGTYIFMAVAENPFSKALAR